MDDWRLRKACADGAKPLRAALFHWFRDALKPAGAPQEPVRIPRNADPGALPDFARIVIAASEPERAFSAQIEPI